jgi:hypothetical protein
MNCRSKMAYNGKVLLSVWELAAQKLIKKQKITI